MPSDPVVIEVRGLDKAFRFPDQRVESLQERLAHPFRRVEHRRLQALSDVSFDVGRGEFFGIVGRNGSGKSTLLKVLASIYGADAGTVRVAGRIAPFIELGVGFNPELTARENIVLNGVLMGLSLREARERRDAVLDFAELREFVELKLKNYSSGMMVRLAFAVMVQADADVMLVDEVLAVGDAAFAQKCTDVFAARRRAGRTVVLVTHDMGTVESLCHRAMLLDRGQVAYIGDPAEAGLEYYRRSFASAEGAGAPAPQDATVELQMSKDHAHLVGPDGTPTDVVDAGEELALDARLEARRHLTRPRFRVNLLNEDGVIVTTFERQLDGVVEVGGRVRLAGAIENALVPGRYHVDCWCLQPRELAPMLVHGLRLLSFSVRGVPRESGVVDLEATVVPRIEVPR